MALPPTIKSANPKSSTPPLHAIGVIFSQVDGSSPNILQSSLILSSNDENIYQRVKQGQFVVVDSNEGWIVGVIEQIQIDNQYFTNHQTVKSFDIAKVNLQQFFPSQQWECAIGNLLHLGMIPASIPFSHEVDPTAFHHIERVGFPPKPGNKVYILEGQYLQHFLGLDPTGLYIGDLKHHALPIRLDLNRLFSKHLAILAQSGAGKSYLISILLEELLARSPDLGTPAIILVDMHGEYKYLKFPASPLQKVGNSLSLSIEDLQAKIQWFNASFMQIGVPDLTEYDFQRFQPGITLPQMRELRKILQRCKEKKRQALDGFNNPTYASENLSESYAVGYDLSQIISELSKTEEINPKVRDTLISWLLDLEQLKIFSRYKSPSLQELARVGELSILDLSSIISMRKKHILLHYFISTLFYARRNQEIPPIILILEEAHNFLPEQSQGISIAKSILETIAREGRKFFMQLVLISQRPVHLSATVLSQCNTQIIMRVSNPNDLNHIKATSEALTKESIHLISTLPTGNALILGAALNFPLFMQVRSRCFTGQSMEENLTAKARNFSVKSSEQSQNVSTVPLAYDIFLDNEIVSMELDQIKETR